VKRLSVVIANYNYEHYVGDAIDSALALRWDDLEVVVVDDGSTDASHEVISRYADRVTVLLTENSGQRVAVNRGYELSSGDVVIFLDSDDVLPPDLPLQLDAVWSSDVSKVQFQMQRIGASGQPIGTAFPQYDPIPTPAQIRRWARTTTAYPTPPGSGNAYARWFLDRLFPVPSSLGDAADSACLAAAPFLGDVIAVPGVIVGYRQHAANDSNLLVDYGRFAREVSRARMRWRFAQQASGFPPDDRPLFRSRELLQLRVAARRVSQVDEALPGESLGRLLLDVLRSPVHVGPEPMVRRMVIVLWCMATLVAPRAFVSRLLALRFGRHR